MATRRKSMLSVELTEGAIRVVLGHKTLTITRSAPPPDAENAADFFVYLDEIVHWDEPNQQVDIEIDELQRIVAAVEDEFERHGLRVEFE